LLLVIGIFQLETTSLFWIPFFTLQYAVGQMAGVAIKKDLAKVNREELGWGAA
jgi:oligoendopeptidase F